MKRPVHPAQAILDNLGITDTNVCSFIIECKGAGELTTITLVKYVGDLPEPTYQLVTRVVDGAQPIECDIDAAVLAALAAVAITIDRAAKTAHQMVKEGFWLSRARIDLARSFEDMKSFTANFDDFSCSSMMLGSAAFFGQKGAAC